MTPTVGVNCKLTIKEKMRRIEVAATSHLGPAVQMNPDLTVQQIQPVPYLLHGINQIRSSQVVSVGQKSGVRQAIMHLSMHLAGAKLKNSTTWVYSD